VKQLIIGVNKMDSTEPPYSEVKITIGQWRNLDIDLGGLGLFVLEKQ
jgi:hypothetical protein